MKRTAFGCVMAALVGVVTPPAVAATDGGHLPPAVHLERHQSRLADLPADAPSALYRAEPKLPAANGWPGNNGAFSRTSGTGRLADGGMFWTDWLYDDH